MYRKTFQALPRLRRPFGLFDAHGLEVDGRASGPFRVGENPPSVGRRRRVRHPDLEMLSAEARFHNRRTVDHLTQTVDDGTLPDFLADTFANYGRQGRAEVIDLLDALAEWDERRSEDLRAKVSGLLPSGVEVPRGYRLVAEDPVPDDGNNDAPDPCEDWGNCDIGEPEAPKPDEPVDLCDDPEADPKECRERPDCNHLEAQIFKVKQDIKANTAEVNRLGQLVDRTKARLETLNREIAILEAKIGPAAAGAGVSIFSGNVLRIILSGSKTGMLFSDLNGKRAERNTLLHELGAYIGNLDDAQTKLEKAKSELAELQQEYLQYCEAS